MRILVTGATGFLGGAVCRSLSRDGEQVLATGRDAARGARLTADGLEFQPADLRDPGAVLRLCEGVDAVVHCAALSSPWGPHEAFLRANVEATESVVNACAAQGVGRLVHISTPSIYMGAGDRQGVREDDPLPPPINAYAATKYQAEGVVGRASVDSVILRPRAIYGPGDTTIFPRLIRALERGILPVFGDGNNRVDLTYIDNAVHAVRRALDASSTALGQPYNISDGCPVLLWQVVRRVCDDLSLPPPRGRLPANVGKVLAGLVEFAQRRVRPDVEPRLTRYSVEVLSSTMTLDIERARTHLGYDPEVMPEQGVGLFVRWWKEERCRA